MYGAIGIEKGDTEKMMAQGRKNYEFFGLPDGTHNSCNAQEC